MLSLQENFADTSAVSTDVQALNMALCSEYDAVLMYDLLAKKATNQLVAQTFQDIANEEKVHIGELQRCLTMLDAYLQQGIDNGGKEVEDQIQQLEKKNNGGE